MNASFGSESTCRASFGIVERTFKKHVILVPIEKRDQQALMKIIIRFGHPGSIIYTDKWKEHDMLSEKSCKSFCGSDNRSPHKHY
jgi:hypothetical protein